MPWVEAADHFANVYRTSADDYDALVRCEDAKGNLWAFLDQLGVWPARTVVELGAGTGRLTAELAARADRVLAFDSAPAMLAVARRHLRGVPNVELAEAEHRRLPVVAGVADLVVEGWALAHYVDFEPDSWADAQDAAIDEARRVLRPGGRIVLVETMGTGTIGPAPPTPALADFFDRLVDRHLFELTVLRTDYRFSDLATAERLVGSFFGPEIVTALDRKHLTLREHTGVFCLIH